MLDEVDRLWVEREGAKSADCVALSEQLEESHEQQQHLREAISEGECLVSSLRGQLEGCQTENEELRAKLDLLRIKVRRLEQSMPGVEESSSESVTQMNSSGLDA